MRNCIIAIAIIAGTAIAAAPALASTPPKASKHGVAWLDDKGELQITYVKGKAGISLPMGELVFDPKTKLAGAPGGMVLEMKETPVATVMLSMSSTGQGSACGRYGDIAIDVSSLNGKLSEISLLEEVTPDSEYLCSIVLPVSHHKMIAISDDYQVFADGKTVLENGGPYVKLSFGGAPAGSAITVSRNGKLIQKLANRNVQEAGITLGSVKKSHDVIIWHVIDRKHNTLKSGQLGFPIAGRTRGLVEYIVSIPKVGANQ